MRRHGSIGGPRTWMSWLLLAVFVALACLSAGVWRGQVQRQNDQAFAAQAASVGSSVTTAVRRMDDLTLAARTLVANDPDLTNQGFAAWYASMGVDKRFRGVAGFAFTEIVRKAVPAVYPPGKRAYYCLPRIGVAGPGMGDALTDAAGPGDGPWPIFQLVAPNPDTGAVNAHRTRSGH